MIITIDTDKERPERLRAVARFLESLAGSEASEPVSEELSFSEEAFSAVFDEPEPKRPVRDDSDDFRVMPY